MPATEAVRRPGPTRDAKEGSWPEPPPEMSETVDPLLDVEVGRWYMILLEASRATAGLVRVMEWRAVWTRWVGSLMKCLAGGIEVFVSGMVGDEAGAIEWGTCYRTW